MIGIAASGRTPYVWLSNQYGNTGIEFRRLAVGFNVNNRVTFVPDPAASLVDCFPGEAFP